MAKNSFDIGFKFYHQYGWWKISTDGDNGWYGAISLKTGAFVSFEHNEIINILKTEHQPPTDHNETINPRNN